MKIDESLLTNIVTQQTELSPAVIQNILVGMITLKYTQSNSICAVSNGHAIGIGSGQQSRILCTDLALTKANKWYQKTLLDLEDVQIPTDRKVTKTEKDQLFEQARNSTFGSTVKLDELPDLCLCSDAFFPQTDNIELAHKFGVKYIASTMGSIRDNDIIEYCNKVGITFINTGVRLFHH
jgi:phosphoribosylaminoimidazolecarboxamide formyltransferase / IMP cyclohydrolase